MSVASDPTTGRIDPARFDAYDTKDIWQKDLDHFVHPWTDFSSFKEVGSLVVAEAEGAYVYDSEGNRYLDGDPL